MHNFVRVVLTGASGVVGGYLLTALCKALPGAELVCVLRDNRSFAKLKAQVPAACAERVTPLFADLRSEHEVAAAIAALPQVASCLTVHCAGDVSWTKSAQLLEPINVDGTRRIAELVVSTTRQAPTFIFLSTAFLAEEGPCRNAYELTKRTAEQVLTLEYGSRMRIGVVRASLVVGESESGVIARFNGIYPLIRLVALGEVPCVIADPTYRIDTVPVDYLAKEILTCADQLAADPTSRLLVAATGPERAVNVRDLVNRVALRTNKVRQNAGLAPLPEISVISNRQYKFLMKAADNWGLKARFARVEQISELMLGYIVHGASGRPIVPTWLTEMAPEPADYLDAVIDHWLAANAQKVLADRHLEWRDSEEPAA